MSRNEAHPITVEVVRNAIVAYADEMGNALAKAAYNMMIYEVRDYCCGLIDTQARMISPKRAWVPGAGVRPTPGDQAHPTSVPSPR